MLAIAEPRERDPKPSVSIVPGGTEIPFCIISQHFVLGYFREVPAGLTFSLGYFREVPAGLIFSNPQTNDFGNAYRYFSYQRGRQIRHSAGVDTNRHFQKPKAAG
jgi:hypothetical protein